jgi:CBS domain-containing protein
MRVADIREFQEKHRMPLSVDVSTPLPEAIRQMADHDYGAIVATRDNRYAGLFTERMLLRDLIANNIALDRLRLGDVIREDAPVAGLEDDALEKVEALNTSPYHHMAVVDEGRHFIGLLSQSDFASLTVGQAMTHAAESAKRGIARAYQPFLIAAGIVIYTLFILALAGDFFAS